MADNLKNPFGIRDGKTILVHDLGENEHGLKCNCICPNCGCRYVARFGEKNKHHFAHEKNALCDEVLAVMTGLYNFITEALSNGGIFCVPGYWGKEPGFDPDISYTMDSYGRAIKFIHRGFDCRPPSGYTCIIQPREITVSTVEVQHDARNYPIAAFLHFEIEGKAGVLAVILIPPPTVCKDVKPKPFQDYPTIALDVEMLEEMDSNKLHQILCFSTEEKKWLSSRKINKWMKDKFTHYQEKLAEWKEQDMRSRQKSALIGVSAVHPEAVEWKGTIYSPGSAIQHPVYGMGTIQKIEAGNSVVTGLYHFITAKFEGELQTFCLEIAIE